MLGWGFQLNDIPIAAHNITTEQQPRPQNNNTVSSEIIFSFHVNTSPICFLFFLPIHSSSTLCTLHKWAVTDSGVSAERKRLWAAGLVTSSQTAAFMNGQLFCLMSLFGWQEHSLPLGAAAPFEHQVTVHRAQTGKERRRPACEELNTYRELDMAGEWQDFPRHKQSKAEPIKKAVVLLPCDGVMWLWEDESVFQTAEVDWMTRSR